MKICLTINSSPWSAFKGGGQLAVHHLACSLFSKGHQVHVLYSKYPHEQFSIEVPYEIHWVHHYNFATFNLNIFSFSNVLGPLAGKEKEVMKIVGWFLGFMNEKWADKIKHLLDEFTMVCEVVKNFGTLAKISVYSALVWVANIFWVYPLYFAFDLQYKTIPSLLILGVMVAILISILPTPGFLGSYNAGIVIALHEVMGESEIKSVSLGMVGWVLFSGAILAGGLYFVFHEHMSLKDLASVKRKRDTSL